MYIKVNVNNAVVATDDSKIDESWIETNEDQPCDIVNGRGEYTVKYIDGHQEMRTAAEISEDYASDFEVMPPEEEGEGTPSETEQLRARVAELEAMLLELM